MIKKTISKALCATLVLTLIFSVTKGQTAGISGKTWHFEKKPVWADEFNYKGKPDPDKWSYDIGGSGWGNKEDEYYTDDIKNASVANGKLSITALKEQVGGKEYSSARILTKNKGDFLYGRFEIRAKLPKARGTWPAIWMLSTDNTYGSWPKSGEIDIMEHVGYALDTIHFSTHSQAYYFRINTQKTSVNAVKGVADNFHVYRIDWTPDAITGYIDNKFVFESLNEGKGPVYWPFDKRFHLLLNVAVGGEWGGKKGIDQDAFPASMEVDYVRVYKMIEK